MSHFEIILDGTAEFPLPAERAVIDIKVSHQDTEKQAVSTAVVSTAREVEALLRELSPTSSSSEAKASAPLEHWSRTSLSESDQISYNSQTGVRTRLYNAEIKFSARFQTFTKLGFFITQLSKLEHVNSQRVEWSLTSKTRASYQSRLRTTAAKNAFQKATEYAEALGYRSVRPIELKEGQSSATPSHRKGGHVPVAAEKTSNEAMNQIEAADWMDVGEEEFAYQPEDVKMTLSLVGKFVAE